MNRSTVRELLRRTGVRPAKRLGQNFLVNDEVLADIEAIVACRKPAKIVEIGPGLGVVTEVLLRHARSVIAVEIDRRLAGYIERRFSRPDALSIRVEDVLRFDFTEELAGEPAYVVGSLPYRITAPILKHLMDHRSALSGALLITQWEVAEKIAASPGREGSALGILVRAYADIELVRKIDRRNFDPIPDVDSALWTISFLDRARFVANEQAFFLTVRTLYNMRRKMLRSALRDLVPPDAVRGILTAARIDGDVRGETLGFDELDRLAKAVDRTLKERQWIDETTESSRRGRSDR
jgi:16S rRNA (adenine1518-N6/adenine1519-N6)-dimethyltransferase